MIEKIKLDDKLEHIKRDYTQIIGFFILITIIFGFVTIWNSNPLYSKIFWSLFLTNVIIYGLTNQGK